MTGRRESVGRRSDSLLSGLDYHTTDTNPARPLLDPDILPYITFRFKYTRRHASKFIPIRRLMDSSPRKDWIHPLISQPSLTFYSQYPRVLSRASHHNFL